MHGIFVCILHPIGCWTNLTGTEMLQRRSCARKTLEVGQLFERHVYLYHRAIGFELPNTFEEAFI